MNAVTLHITVIHKLHVPTQMVALPAYAMLDIMEMELLVQQVIFLAMNDYKWIVVYIYVV